MSESYCKILSCKCWLFGYETSSLQFFAIKKNVSWTRVCESRFNNEKEHYIIRISVLTFSTTIIGHC